MKKVAVCGGAGFIGWHLCKRLRADGHYVVAYDIKYPEFASQKEWPANEYHVFDLRNDRDYFAAFRWQEFDEVYQLAADMGGAEHVFSGKHDAEIVQNSARINLNILDVCHRAGVNKIFFASSACVYPTLPEWPHTTIYGNGSTQSNAACREEDAGNPDSPYGAEKLFSEVAYASYAKQYGMEVRIGRFHNIFGPYGTWQGGREKSPAAFCRKIAETPNGGTIDCFGDGEQTRSFLYVDEAVEGVLRLMESNFQGPVNIGSSEMVSINDLIAMIARKIAQKVIYTKPIPGPLGVRGRNSDNTLIEQKLGWKPTGKLIDGLIPTYNWISGQVEKRNKRLAEAGKG